MVVSFFDGKQEHVARTSPRERRGAATYSVESGQMLGSIRTCRRNKEGAFRVRLSASPVQLGVKYSIHG